jgi:hypothetical protein
MRVMVLAPEQSWKLVLAIVLCVAIVLSAGAKAPRRAVPSGELRNLVLAALLLYAVGALASLRHRSVLATLVYAAGIGVCAFAAWLSRGRGDSDDPPGGGWDDPFDEHPPPGPEGEPFFDWPAFERDLRAYAADREREPAAIDR